MSDSNKNFLKTLLVVSGLGALGDGFTTTITLLSIFRHTNFLTITFAIFGAIFITALTAKHSDTFGKVTPTSIKVVAVIAILIDIITSFVGTTYYVALGYDIGGPIDWSKVECCDWSNTFGTLAAWGLAAMFNISTLSIDGIYRKLRE